MAPPTLCIIALTIFQVGVAELIRPSVLHGLSRGGAFARATGVFTRFALPLFLFHTTGMALSRGVEWSIFGTQVEGTEPTLTWWLLRPVAIIGPLLATLPVIYLFGRRWRTQTVEPPPRILPILDEEVGDGGDPPLMRRWDARERPRDERERPRDERERARDERERPRDGRERPRDERERARDAAAPGVSADAGSPRSEGADQAVAGDEGHPPHRLWRSRAATKDASR